MKLYKDIYDDLFNANGQAVDFSEKFNVLPKEIKLALLGRIRIMGNNYYRGSRMVSEPNMKAKIESLFREKLHLTPIKKISIRREIDYALRQFKEFQIVPPDDLFKLIDYYRYIDVDTDFLHKCEDDIIEITCIAIECKLGCLTPFFRSQLKIVLFEILKYKTDKTLERFLEFDIERLRKNPFSLKGLLYALTRNNSGFFKESQIIILLYQLFNEVSFDNPILLHDLFDRIFSSKKLPLILEDFKSTKDTETFFRELVEFLDNFSSFLGFSSGDIALLKQKREEYRNGQVKRLDKIVDDLKYRYLRESAHIEFVSCLKELSLTFFDPEYILDEFSESCDSLIALCSDIEGSNNLSSSLNDIKINISIEKNNLSTRSNVLTQVGAEIITFSVEISVIIDKIHLLFVSDKVKKLKLLDSWNNYLSQNIDFLILQGQILLQQAFNDRCDDASSDNSDDFENQISSWQFLPILEAKIQEWEDYSTHTYEGDAIARIFDSSEFFKFNIQSIKKDIIGIPYTISKRSNQVALIIHHSFRSVYSESVIIYDREKYHFLMQLSALIENYKRIKNRLERVDELGEELDIQIRFLLKIKICLENNLFSMAYTIKNSDEECVTIYEDLISKMVRAKFSAVKFLQFQKQSTHSPEVDFSSLAVQILSDEIILEEDSIDKGKQSDDEHLSLIKKQLAIRVLLSDFFNGKSKEHLVENIDLFNRLFIMANSFESSSDDHLFKKLSDLYFGIPSSSHNIGETLSELAQIPIKHKKRISRHANDINAIFPWDLKSPIVLLPSLADTLMRLDRFVHDQELDAANTVVTLQKSTHRDVKLFYQGMIAVLGSISDLFSTKPIERIILEILLYDTSILSKLKCIETNIVVKLFTPFFLDKEKNLLLDIVLPESSSFLSQVFLNLSIDMFFDILDRDCMDCEFSEELLQLHVAKINIHLNQMKTREESERMTNIDSMIRDRLKKIILDAPIGLLTLILDGVEETSSLISTTFFLIDDALNIRKFVRDTHLDICLSLFNVDRLSQERRVLDFIKKKYLVIKDVKEIFSIAEVLEKNYKLSTFLSLLIRDLIVQPPCQLSAESFIFFAALNNDNLWGEFTSFMNHSLEESRGEQKHKIRKYTVLNFLVWLSKNKDTAVLQGFIVETIREFVRILFRMDYITRGNDRFSCENIWNFDVMSHNLKMKFIFLLDIVLKSNHVIDDLKCAVLQILFHDEKLLYMFLTCDHSNPLEQPYGSGHVALTTTEKYFKDRNPTLDLAQQIRNVITHSIAKRSSSDRERLSYFLQKLGFQQAEITILNALEGYIIGIINKDRRCDDQKKMDANRMINAILCYLPGEEIKCIQEISQKYPAPAFFWRQPTLARLCDEYLSTVDFKRQEYPPEMSMGSGRR